VRTLLSDITELKADHAAQLAASQQQIQLLSDQLAAQQLTYIQQQQRQRQQHDLVLVESRPGSGGKAHASLQRPRSAAAATVQLYTAAMRPQSATAAAAAGGSKPSWLITGSAALVTRDYKKDLTYAGALLDSNVQKNINLASGNNSQPASGSSGSNGSMRSRPGTAPAKVLYAGSSGSNGGSSDDSALLLKLREQVRRETMSELQTKAVQLLQAYSATAAAAAAAAAAAKTGEQVAEVTLEAQADPMSAASTAAAVTQLPQHGDVLVLAEHAVQLQEELNRWVKSFF
jgi:hypothetical protein